MSLYQYRAEPRTLAAQQRRLLNQSIAQSQNSVKYREDVPSINIMRDPRVVRGTNYGRSNAPISHANDAPITMVDQCTLPTTFKQTNSATIKQSNNATRLTATIRQSIKSSFNSTLTQLRTSALPSDARPATPDAVEGRQHFASQTDPLYEDLRLSAELALLNQSTQTDTDLDFDTPVMFEPRSSGQDVSTMINQSITQPKWVDSHGNLLPNLVDFGPGLRDFDRDVQSINETLIDRTLNEALSEVTAEREIAQLNEAINQSTMQANAQAEKVAKLQRIEDLIAEEKARRWAEQSERQTQQANEQDEYQQQLLQHQQWVDHAIQQSIEQSIDQAPVILRQEIEQEFLPWLIEQVNQSMQQTNNRRRSFDQLLMQAVDSINQSISQSVSRRQNVWFNNYVSARVNNQPLPGQTISQSVNQTNNRRECFLSTLNNQSIPQPVIQSLSQESLAEQEAQRQISAIRAAEQEEAQMIEQIKKIQSLSRARAARLRVNKIKARKQLLADRQEMTPDQLIASLIACLNIRVSNYQPPIKEPVEEPAETPVEQPVEESKEQLVDQSVNQSTDLTNDPFVITLSTASNASTRPSTTMLASTAPSGIQSSSTQPVSHPTGGLLIERVRSMSTAHFAGLLAGDVILSIDGHQLEDPSTNQTTYQSTITAKKPGDTVSLVVYRPSSDRIDTLTAELAATEKEYDVMKVRELRKEVKMHVDKSSPYDAETALAELQKVVVKFGMTAVKRPKPAVKDQPNAGAMVSKMLPGGAAEKAGLKDGDVIVKVQHQIKQSDEQSIIRTTPINSVDDWKEVSANWLAGEPVTLILLDPSNPNVSSVVQMQNQDVRRVLEVGSSGKKNTLEWVRTLRSIAKLNYVRNPITSE